MSINVKHINKLKNKLELFKLKNNKIINNNELKPTADHTVQAVSTHGSPGDQIHHLL